MVEMDPKLVAKTEQYEIAYFAVKHGLTAAQAREIITKSGPSRERADELAEQDKKPH